MTTWLENGKRYTFSKYITKAGELRLYKSERKSHSQQKHKPKCYKCKKALSKAFIRTSSSVDKIQIGWYCRTCERFYYFKEILPKRNLKMDREIEL